MELALILGGLTLAELVAIIVLARQVGKAKANARLWSAENEGLRRVLDEMGKPVPSGDDPDALLKWLQD